VNPVKYCTLGAAGGGGKRTYFLALPAPGPVVQPANKTTNPATASV